MTSNPTTEPTGRPDLSGPGWGADVPAGEEQLVWADPEPLPERPEVSVSRLRHTLAQGWDWFSQSLGLRPMWVVVGGAAILCAIVGGIVGWWELRIVAVALGLVWLCSFAFIIGSNQYGVRLTMMNRKVVVGERAPGLVQVANTGQNRNRGGRLELPIGNEIATFSLPGLASMEVHSEPFEVPTRRRGIVEIGPVRSVKGDPFGLLAKQRSWTESLTLYIHPRTVRLPGSQRGYIKDLEGQPSSDLAAADMSFHALREYVPGDERRHIHWRSTARTGQLMVRQFEETRRSHVAIGLDCARESYTSEDEFELAVSVAGSMALEALREGHTATLWSTGGQHGAASAQSIMNDLAGIEMGRGTLFDTTHAITNFEHRASLITMVTGSRPEATELRRHCAGFDLDARVLAVQVNLGAEVQVRTVGRLSQVTVGTLEDLPATIRRALR